jgi:hypothetical protein
MTRKAAARVEGEPPSEPGLAAWPRLTCDPLQIPVWMTTFRPNANFSFSTVGSLFTGYLQRGCALWANHLSTADNG